MGTLYCWKSLDHTWNGILFESRLWLAKNAYFNLESKNMKAMVKSIEDMGKSDFAKLLVYNPDKTVKTGTINIETRL